MALSASAKYIVICINHYIYLQNFLYQVLWVGDDFTLGDEELFSKTYYAEH